MNTHKIGLFGALVALLVLAAAVSGDAPTNQKLSGIEVVTAGQPAVVKTLDHSDHTVMRITEPAQSLQIAGDLVDLVHGITRGEQQRQGGEDSATATVIVAMPFTDTGTTTGYADDYNAEECLGVATNAPDVIYSYTPATHEVVDVDLCLSSYYTNLFICENDFSNVIACNRFAGECGATAASYIADIPCYAGNTYYIVVDGDYAAPNSGDYIISCTSVPMPPPITPQSLHPTLAAGPCGFMMHAFEYQGNGDSLVFWTGSADNGDTWMDPIAWETNGAHHPTADYWGDDSIFYATMVPGADDFSGGAVYLVQCFNPGFSAFYSLLYWNWSDDGWYDMLSSEIACANTQEAWEWGFIALVSSTSYTSPDYIAGPFITYQTTEGGGGTISWYPGFDGCAHAAADIDPSIDQTYAVYDWLDPADNTWNLLVRQDWFGEVSGNWDIEGSALTYKWGSTKEHLQYPSVAAANGNILIVAEYWDENSGSDRDIGCFRDNHADISSLTSGTVIATSDEERYPDLAHITGNEYLCTFHRGDTLMMTTTTDAGASWSTPVMFSGVDTVRNDFRASDISEYGQRIAYSYAAGDTTWIRIDTTGFAPDSDGDGIGDCDDNCPTVPNPGQEDADGDGIGDVCDDCTDTDSDGFGDPGFPANTCALDNCPDLPNPGQEDADADGIGDACDSCTDLDNDGYGHPDFYNPGCDNDNCPELYNPDQEDVDLDLVGDSCDNCFEDPNAGQEDMDSDGVGDICDNCPNGSNPGQEDADGDGFGDVCDQCPGYDDNADGDSDAVADSCDNCPDDFNPFQEDADGDGIGDVCDECTDTDGDGYGDPGYAANTCDVDNCPDDYNPGQEDTDGNGVGDLCCCEGIRGDVDVDGQQKVNIADLTYIVAYLFIGGTVPGCPDEGNVDGIAAINLADLTYLVQYLFATPSGPAPPDCP